MKIKQEIKEAKALARSLMIEQSQVLPVYILSHNKERNSCTVRFVGDLLPNTTVPSWISKDGSIKDREFPLQLEGVESEGRAITVNTPGYLHFNGSASRGFVTIAHTPGGEEAGMYCIVRGGIFLG